MKQIRLLLALGALLLLAGPLRAAPFKFYEAPNVSTQPGTNFATMGLAGRFRIYKAFNDQTEVLVLSATAGIITSHIVSTTSVTKSWALFQGSATVAGHTLIQSTLTLQSGLILADGVSIAQKLADIAASTNTLNTNFSTQAFTTAMAQLAVSTTALSASTQTLMTALNSTAAAVTTKFAEIAVATSAFSSTRMDNLDASTATLTTALKSTAATTTTALNNIASSTAALTTRIGNLDSSTATLTTAINSTAATATAKYSEIAMATSTLATRAGNLDSSTATLTTALNSTAAAVTTGLNNLASSTAALTTRIGNLDSSTATLTTAINSTAAAATTKFLEIAASTAGLAAGAADPRFTLFVDTAQTKIEAAGGFTLAQSTINSRLNNLDSSTATLTTAINSTAAVQTTKNLEISAATSTLFTTMAASEAVNTTKFNNVVSATGTLTTAINSTAAATTTALNNLNSSTATLTTAINSTAAAVTTGFNNVATSTNAVKDMVNSTYTALQTTAAAITTQLTGGNYTVYFGSANIESITSTGPATFKELSADTTDFQAGCRLAYVSHSSMVVVYASMTSYGNPMFQAADSTGTYACFICEFPPGTQTDLDPLLDKLVLESTGTERNPQFAMLAVGTPTASGIGNGVVLWTSSFSVTASSPTAGMPHQQKQNSSQQVLTGWKTPLSQSRTIMVKLWFWAVNCTSQRWPQTMTFLSRRRT